ncbi:thiamine pyrophosphate-dependent enzyme [Piscirickettsia litoralis]|uniref:3-methyl-2-oxobutanoate dehydrogenase (2-methylpropanoyl-transferring) n=1 Tax=Piscirickettsia litoralis TaxID=1891921 RepID=A0ABX3AAX8_9GAMM|nr:thiamine pyrophosphate-dependent enzyme [Piscirickettsia litoralis]ODN43289.1 hypothetical protein BGC07_10610 [Piscirickettsia litoralis]
MKLSKENNKDVLCGIYNNMLSVRKIDELENELVNSGRANFLCSSKGHEGIAVFAQFLEKEDWLYCHYRDKPLIYARGLSAQTLFHSSLCSQESPSAGRHMVIGVCSKDLNIASIVTPVGNHALHAVGTAHVIKERKQRAITFCSMGDGTTQQGEVYEAIAEAARSQLPILFVIENNSLAISSRTDGKTFYSHQGKSEVTEFFGVPISYIDGTQPLKEIDKIENLVGYVRNEQRPHIVIFNVERLNSHSNADDFNIYRTQKEIDLFSSRDPVINSRKYLEALGISEDYLTKVEKEAHNNITRELAISLESATQPTVCLDAMRPLPELLRENVEEYRGDDSLVNQLTMRDAIRSVLDFQLKQQDDIYLYGEDIEDPKGDVFGVTKGLSTQYPGKVVNSPLSEATIVGSCIGRALTGQTAVAFIQFIDFIGPAYNQIANELATMYWRSNGQLECPVIILVACGGYRPGLGPFHAQSNESIFAHLPGIDVYQPSNAGDAAGLLNTAFASKRPSIFFYPKKLLNRALKEEMTSSDIHRHIVPVGKARILSAGNDITFVSWGNTVSLCSEVAQALSAANVEAEIIDLRTIHPYDLDTVVKSVNKTKNIIVVHEDNITCGMASEIISAVVENVNTAIRAKRVARYDTHIPCNFKNHLEVMPSFERILSECCTLLGYELSWVEAPVKQNTELVDIKVIGASPSDDNVLITDLFIKAGDHIKKGDKLADIEASKSTSEIRSPYTGVVKEIYVGEYDTATVGSNLLSVKLSGDKGLFTAVNELKPVIYKKV